MQLAVVGIGYWGPNIVRNAIENKRIDEVYVFDKYDKQVQSIKEKYRHVKLCASYNEILKNSNIDSVAIVTPVSTHFELVKKALESGKHVIVEKPFPATSKQAE